MVLSTVRISQWPLHIQINIKFEIFVEYLRELVLVAPTREKRGFQKYLREMYSAVWLPAKVDSLSGNTILALQVCPCNVSRQVKQMDSTYDILTQHFVMSKSSLQYQVIFVFEETKFNIIFLTKISVHGVEILNFESRSLGFQIK